jgi:hypothetical protein
MMNFQQNRRASQPAITPVTKAKGHRRVKLVKLNNKGCVQTPGCRALVGWLGTR